MYEERQTHTRRMETESAGVKRTHVPGKASRKSDWGVMNRRRTKKRKMRRIRGKRWKQGTKEGYLPGRGLVSNELQSPIYLETLQSATRS